LKQQELEDNQVEKEVRRVEKCDGTEPSQVKCWLKELDLVPLGQRLEVARRTATRQLRRELERYVTGNGNAAWVQVRTHLLQAFVSADHLEALRKEVESFRQEMHEISCRTTGNSMSWLMKCTPPVSEIKTKRECLLRPTERAWRMMSPRENW